MHSPTAYELRPNYLSSYRSCEGTYHGKFHQYSIGGCQVESFQNFVLQIDSSSMNWPFLEGFWVLTPPNMVQFFRNAYQRYLSSKQKHCLKNFRKSGFLWKFGGLRVCIFGLPLRPRFPLKMAKIKKVLHRKTSVIELCKYVKIKAPSYLSFAGKIRLLFAIFRLFLVGIKVGQFPYDHRSVNIVSAIAILTSLLILISFLISIFYHHFLLKWFEQEVN